MYPTGYEGSTIFLRLPRLSASSHAMMGYDGQMGSLDGLNRSSTFLPLMDRQSVRGPQEPGLDPRTLRDPLYSSDASIPACRQNCATAMRRSRSRARHIEISLSSRTAKSREAHSGKHYMHIPGQLERSRPSNVVILLHERA